MRRNNTICLIVGLVLLLSMCRKPQPFPADQNDPQLSGGVNTVFDATSKAFGSAFPGLGGHDLAIHDLGDQQFGNTFVASPAPVNPGLGPLFNNVSCSSCHHNDGEGIPQFGGLESGLLLRISQANATDAHGGPAPVPGYGLQLHDQAITGVQPQCSISISYTYQTYTLRNGMSYELRTPTYTVSNPYTGSIPGPYLVSPRMAPPVYGRGMLEAIPESSILANADPNDANGDGISGRPNYVWDTTTQSMQLGRFGLKANVASVLTQVASAFVNDMGITNRIFPNENCAGTRLCDGVTATKPDLADSLLNAVKFYIQTLAVPARRNVTDSLVLQGQQIFIAAKCSHCHIPDMTTGTNVAFPPLSNQLIHPYSDLLLHDMGRGLADGRPDYDASGQEWRTPPLWGLGLFPVVNNPPYYLHDGRARSLLEAIMWHDGEAAGPKAYVQQLRASEMNALLAFLGSL